MRTWRSRNEKPVWNRTSSVRCFSTFEKIRPFIQTQIKESIKAPRHWPLCGEFTGTGEFPAQRASYAENVSIWWRHHVVLEIIWRLHISDAEPSFDFEQQSHCRLFSTNTTSSNLQPHENSFRGLTKVQWSTHWPHYNISMGNLLCIQSTPRNLYAVHSLLLPCNL